MLCCTAVVLSKKESFEPASMRWFLLNLVSKDAKIHLPVPLGVSCSHKRWKTVICSGSFAAAVVHSPNHWFKHWLVSD